MNTSFGYFPKSLFWPFLWGALGLMTHSCLPDKPTNPLLTGTGSYVFTPPAPLLQRPVTLHYFIPDDFQSNTPVLLLLHGNERNATEYRDALVSQARAKRVILIAPEFSETQFPGNNNYHLGGMFADGEQAAISPLLPPEQWTFALPDRFFADVCKKNNLQNTGFFAIGHSAGAQFLHRFLMFWPGHGVTKAVVSAAGWYDLPDTTLAFPHGLRYSPYTMQSLRNYCALPLQLQVGLADNNPGSSGLRHDSITDLQGTHRLARARNYRQAIQNWSATQGMTPAWGYREVAGLDHDFEPALQEAFKTLFP